MPGGSSPQRSAGQFIFRMTSCDAPRLSALRYSTGICGAASKSWRFTFLPTFLFTLWSST
jgi:hypothetical protein